MLDLKNVTLLSIDVKNPERTVQSLLYSMDFVRFGAVILATNVEALSPHFSAPHLGIQLVHTTQSDTKITGPSRDYFLDYEVQAMTLPADVCKTDFVLFQEWDSAILNPRAWNSSWLETDYIGAPWREYYDSGWPPTTSNMRVGNGGFSLRSRKFCEATREMTYKLLDDPTIVSYDQWMCRTIRPHLESKGLVFASLRQAYAFSCEDSIYSGQFGFHGKNTAKINGWNLEWMR